MQTVTQHAHEASLDALQSLPGSTREGFFGPGSLSWRVNRESSVFFGAGRAALLQVAHPWVAAALQQHSTLLHDAVARFHSTFHVVYTMVFGTRAQALTAARQLWRRHAGITGVVPGTAERYQANQAGALQWVYATLVESALLAHELAQGPLSRAEQEQYYQESRRVAVLCGIPLGMLPADWQAFRAYTAAVFASSTLRVDAAGRELGQSVLQGAGAWLPIPCWYRDLTAGWLPAHLRPAFGLRWGAVEQRRARTASRWIARVYPWLPTALRYVGPYREAAARVGDGRYQGAAARAWTRAGTRVWTGSSALLYATNTVTKA